MIGNPKERAEPVPEPLDGLLKDLIGLGVTEQRLTSALAGAGNDGDWAKVWTIADAIGVEVSLLFDADDGVWVDIGTPGSVRLDPPSGARLPFRLWVHSHPREAYWSATDRRTLAIASSVLTEALVLGHDHLKRSRSGADAPYPRLDSEGPLSEWSDEAIEPYMEVP